MCMSGGNKYILFICLFIYNTIDIFYSFACLIENRSVKEENEKYH